MRWIIPESLIYDVVVVHAELHEDELSGDGSAMPTNRKPRLGELSFSEIEGTSV